MVKKIFKYYIGHDNHGCFGLSCIKLRQMIGYVKHFDSNKTMSFKVIGNKVLKKDT